MTQKEKLKFYKSIAWRKKRDYIMQRDHYQCQECLKRVTTATAKGIELTGRDRYINRATQVHHIQHLDERPDLALDDDNLEAVCLHCHNVLHGRDTDNLNKLKKKDKPVSEEKW